MAKFAINAMLLPNLIQVTESISGSVVPLAMFYHLSLPHKMASQALGFDSAGKGVDCWILLHFLKC